MVDLLKDLQASVPEEKKQQIDDLLGRDELTEEKVIPNVPVTATASGSRDAPDPRETPGEDNVSAEVGSNDETDMIDEDLLEDEDSLATGFVGKSSEVQWLRRVRQETELRANTPAVSDGPYGPPGDSPEAVFGRMEAFKRRRQQQPKAREPVRSSTFYLDEATIEVDYSANPFELPSVNIAQTLVDSYMTTVQDTFPVLSKPDFKNQVYQYYESFSQGTPSAMPETWLAILNLVFAIGAKHAQMVQANWLVDGQDHFVYHSRAQILSLSGPALVSHPDPLQTQLTALLAFYFLSVGRANRAWVVLGTAIRYAHALGLHVRNEDPTASVNRKETLVHMWWALYTLEVKLSAMVGRPNSASDYFCSVPLPLPVAKEQLINEKVPSQYFEQYRAAGIHQTSVGISSATFEPANAGSFLKAIVQISIITQKAMVELYSVRVVTRSWKHMQESIASLRDQLEMWSSCLPSDFHFTRPNVDATLARERCILKMYHIGTRMLITRPCLCRLDSRIPNQTKASDDMNKTMARDCVDAAKAMANILPDQVDLPYLYQTGPWWSLVHYLMQALTVLLLEMSYGTVHFPEDGKEVTPSAKKLIRWLRAMKENDPLAQRAYTVAFELLQKVASQGHVDITDLLAEESASHGAAQASGFEDPFGPSRHDQSRPFSTGEHSQQMGQEGHGTHPAMFGFPSGQDEEHYPHPPFAHGAGTHIFNPPFSGISFGNMFSTVHDEQDSVPPNDDFLE
ncbi:uncharacterized protein N0V89_002151 [Didymosphaeria variabile]|uniref:Xylanolytic transcriptional activator regulatory domain-containing protein n=1 Tax=Didymosphaeria variabile TaxID=1932322 RepID=A0A9W9CE44_9PLEO|nr:uncharacterized protein N0V89_002151 [Didymosphaeria variabile]KAJ4357575.1 hypothetical protein N0V89_002151 [Didymosphaeria variabile]